MKMIDGQRCYKPREVAQLGLIKGRKGDKGTITGHYNFVMELIWAGKLRTINYSKGRRPYYLVPESEIARYHKGKRKAGA